MDPISSASQQEYQCTCGYTQIVCVKDIEENYKFTEELSKRLKDIYGPIPFMPAGEYSAIMKVETTCEVCQASIDVTVEVNGVPLWNNDVFWGDFEPWIENFSDIRIVRVLPSTSNIVGYHLDRFKEEPFLEPEFDYLPDLEDIPNTQEFEEENFVNLNVIAQTSMKSGYCHLGFDSQSERILRPLHRLRDGCCCWDVPLDVDQTYAFRILSSPRDGSERFTPLPHGNDDLLVHNQAIRMEGNESKLYIFQQLKTLSNLSVEEIFGPKIKEKKYLDEGTDCPSVGVLSCRGRDLKLVRDPFNSKRRLKISGGYNPRITAFDARELPEELPDKPTLVILGLGRPFEGTGGNHFEPRRCYILVLRILQNP